MYVAGAKTSNPNSSSWCLDIDTRDCVIARWNVLAGHWAGRLLGLSNADLSSYTAEVHLADFEMDGDGDIVGKVARDLAVHSPSLSEQQVREKLHAYHREAFCQNAVTD